MLLPFAGARDYLSPITIVNQGVYGQYWSSTPFGLSARGVHMNGNIFNATINNAITYGYSVRCFADEMPIVGEVNYSSTGATS